MKHTRRSRTSRLAWLAIPVAAGLTARGLLQQRFHGARSRRRSPSPTAPRTTRTRPPTTASPRRSRPRTRGSRSRPRTFPSRATARRSRHASRAATPPTRSSPRAAPARPSRSSRGRSPDSCSRSTTRRSRRTCPTPPRDLYTYNGKIYGVPLGTQLNGVIYNDELAQSIGVKIDATTSLDDIIAQCGKARAAGKTVYGLAGSTFQNNGILAVALATSTVYGPDKDWNARPRAEQGHLRRHQGLDDRPRVDQEDVRRGMLPGRRHQRRVRRADQRRLLGQDPRLLRSERRGAADHAGGGRPREAHRPPGRGSRAARRPTCR